MPEDRTKSGRGSVVRSGRDRVAAAIRARLNRSTAAAPVSHGAAQAPVPARHPAAAGKGAAKHGGGRRHRGRAGDVPDVATTFFTAITHEADIDAAAVAATRQMIVRLRIGQARAFAQALADHDGLRATGELCRAMIAQYDRMLPVAWTLLQRNDIATVLRLVPDVFVRVGFQLDREVTTAALRRVFAGELVLVGDASTWLDIAELCFAADLEDLSALALDRVDDLLAAAPADKAAEQTADTVSAAADRLRSWLGRAARAAAAPGAIDGEIAVAVLDYNHPDRTLTSIDTATSVRTLATLGHLARRTGLRFTGEEPLVTLVEELRGAMRPELTVDGDDAIVRLLAVDRDATSYCEVPDGTWLLATGWLLHPIFSLKLDLPLNPRLRPIFMGFGIDPASLRGPEQIEYLRKYAPIGCRDWATVFLLQTAGIPSFFSGCISTTADLVVPAGPDARPAGTLFVDADPSESEYASTAPPASWDAPRMADRPLTKNLREARGGLRRMRTSYRRVVTSRLTCYLAARALGMAAELQDENAVDDLYDGLNGADQKEFDATRTAMLDKLAAVLGWIAAGKSEDDVYALWRDLCAADVEYARSLPATVPPMPPPTFDVAEGCARIRAASVTIERSEPGPSGDEINVEFSLDGNLKHEMGVVLESIVTRCSRPIRLFVLCRDHDAPDYERMARLFPTVSFVWLPTDDVDYGNVIGMIKHITIATMDRLLLPDLLPEIDRIIHHDLDALCLADLAELYEIDMEGMPIAARDQLNPNPSGIGGHWSGIRKRHGDKPELAWDRMLRVTAMHAYDYDPANAGIMVLDLAVMRADGFTRNFLPWVERFGQNDQEVLNSYLGARRKQLDYAWNAFPRLEVMDNPKIVHWLGSQKPWRERYVGGRDLWREADALFTERAGRVD